MTLDVLRRSRIPASSGHPLGRLVYPVDRVTAVFGMTGRPLKTSTVRRRIGDVVFILALIVALGYGAFRVIEYIAGSVGFTEVGHAALLGLATFARVVVVVVVSTLIWVPIGVWIGLNPKVTRLAQPVVQVLASFPANFLFPLFAAVLLATGISLNWGGILLMALGTQWYILFNVIAGASAIPTELRDAAASLRLPTRAEVAHPDTARQSSAATSPAASPPPGARGTLPSSLKSSNTTAPRCPLSGWVHTSRTPPRWATPRACSSA